MSFPIDAALKDFFEEHPADFAAAFGLPADQPTTVLNVDLSTISAATDIVLGVGEPVSQIADFNFQSGCDPIVDYRIHLYNAALAHHFHGPVRSILILLRPKADHPNLTGFLAYNAGRTKVEFTYEVVRLWQQPVESFLHGGLGLLPLATLCALPPGVPVEAALAHVVAEIHKRSKVEMPPAEAQKIMTAACVLTGLRVDRVTLRRIYEEYTMFEDSSALELFMENNEIRWSKRTLLSQGRVRFGVPNAAVETTLKAINDPERLQRMLEAIVSADDWQELLDTP